MLTILAKWMSRSFEFEFEFDLVERKRVIDACVFTASRDLSRASPEPSLAYGSWVWCPRQAAAIGIADMEHPLTPGASITLTDTVSIHRLVALQAAASRDLCNDYGGIKIDYFSMSSPMQVRLETKKRSALAIGGYPTFKYNAAKGGGVAKVLGVELGVAHVRFDPDSVKIPSLTWKTGEDLVFKPYFLWSPFSCSPIRRNLTEHRLARKVFDIRCKGQQ